MKKIITSALALALLCGACGNSRSNAEAEQERDERNEIARTEDLAAKRAADSAAAAKAAADSLATLRQTEETDMAVIRTFYKKAVFNGPDGAAVRANTTKALQNRLQRENEYDDGGYAVWNMRSGAQDGPSDVSKVTGVTPLGDGWYKVSFLDMGVKGSKKVKMEDGKIADYK